MEEKMRRCVPHWRLPKFTALVRRSFVIFCTILLGLFFILDANVRIIRIKTPSIPYKYCVLFLKIAPKKGDLCVFKKNGMTLVKYLQHAGLPKSDTIAPGGTPVPEGYAFVVGTHPNSFDSRYKEFGLVKISDIQGRAIGFWRRDEN